MHSSRLAILSFTALAACCLLLSLRPTPGASAAGQPGGGGMWLSRAAVDQVAPVTCTTVPTVGITLGFTTCVGTGVCGVTNIFTSCLPPPPPLPAAGPFPCTPAAPSTLADGFCGGSRSGTASVVKVVILAAGIDARATKTCSGSEVLGGGSCDPYKQVQDTFETLTIKLGCPTISGRSDLNALAGIVTCSSGVGWIPYSYNGVDSNGVRDYNGAATNQSLSGKTGSIAAMQHVVDFANKLVPGAKLYIVGHSLGGAVGSAWAGSTGAKVPVISLDSPVYGIWPSTASVPGAAALNTYCVASVGLFNNPADTANCELLQIPVGLSSAAAASLRDVPTQLLMGSSTTINFANVADPAVPSWDAINPGSGVQQLINNSGCSGNPLILFLRLHGCVIKDAGVVRQIADFIASGTPIPSSGSIARSITLNLVLTNTDGQDVTITVQPEGYQAQTLHVMGDNALSVTEPWVAVLVTARWHTKGLIFGLLSQDVCNSVAALPAGNVNLSLTLGNLREGVEINGLAVLPRDSCYRTAQ